MYIYSLFLYHNRREREVLRNKNTRSIASSIDDVEIFLLCSILPLYYPLPASPIEEGYFIFLIFFGYDVNSKKERYKKEEKKCGILLSFFCASTCLYLCASTRKGVYENNYYRTVPASFVSPSSYHPKKKEKIYRIFLQFIEQKNKEAELNVY